MERRDFLKILSALSTRAILPAPIVFLSRSVLASTVFDPASAHFFVLIRIQGGWDVTLGLDPKVHVNGSTQEDMFIEYSPDQIVKIGNIPLAPAAAGAMKPFANEFSVVNGLITATSDNGHDANLNYISSGNGEGKAPFLPVEIAASAASGSLGVVVTNTTQALDREVMVSTVSSIESLSTSLGMNSFSGAIENSPVQGDFRAGQQALLKNADSLQELIAQLKVIQSANPQLQDTARSAAVIAAAFKSGMSLEAQVDINIGNLDTHSAHEKVHLDLQTKSWESVATVFDTFKKIPVGNKGQSLFDRTVFMVISEFSRTPALNSSKGKDHNPLSNSTLFAGGGVQGGQVFGRSHLIMKKNSANGMPMHTAMAVDFSTGTVADSRAIAEGSPFQFITPENLVATVATAMKVDWTRFRSVDSNTRVISSFIKSSW